MRKLNSKLFRLYTTSAFILISYLLCSQITIPINNKELQTYNREKDIISFLKIDLSQTWLYLVKDGIVSSNKVLAQEIYFNKSGLASKMLFYNTDKSLNNFIIVNYNSNFLPFEEIKFNADSILISGVMYEYDATGWLHKQTNYDNNNKIVATQIYNRYNDSIVIDIFDEKNVLVYKNTMFFNNSSQDGLIKKMEKSYPNNKHFEKTLYEYDNVQSLRRKTILNANVIATSKDFIYNEDGALIRTIVQDFDSKIISDTSFEYDSYGNMTRIIETGDDKGISKLYFINYLSKADNK